MLFSMSAAPRAFLAAAVVGAAVRAAPDADLVTGLPGWDGALPSKHYSGFLNASTHHVHYVFVEASTADPATAPVGRPLGRCLHPRFRSSPIREYACMPLRLHSYDGSKKC